MLRIKDSNGPRFLRLITQQFLYSYSHYLKPEEMSQRFDPYIFLWDHLVNLWIFVVIDVGMSPLKRVEWRELFRHWADNPNCPREDTYFLLDIDGLGGLDLCARTMPGLTVADGPAPMLSAVGGGGGGGGGGVGQESNRRSYISTIRRRKILERALDATFITWDDSNLQFILNGGNNNSLASINNNNGFFPAVGKASKTSSSSLPEMGGGLKNMNLRNGLNPFCYGNYLDGDGQAIWPGKFKMAF